MRTVRLLTMVAVVSTVLLSCAIPQDQLPRNIDPKVVPAGLRNPTRTVKVFAKRKSGVASFNRAIELTPDLLTTSKLVAAELRKPLSAAEKQIGYSSDLSADDAAFSVSDVSGRRVILDLTNAPGLADDGTRLGQIVLTFTSLSQIDSVDFEANGEPVKRLINAKQEVVAPPLTKAQFDTLEVRTQTANVYFVRNSQLVRRDALIDSPESLDNTTPQSVDYLSPLIIDKLNPPTDGLESYVGAGTSLGCLDAQNPVCTANYVVDFGSDFIGLTRLQQALAVGQVLYTLEGWRSLGKVSIRVAGKTLPAIPLPDGSSSAAKVDKTQYEPLLADQA